MNERIGSHLVILWILASGLLFAFQYAFDSGIDARVLTYLIPGCTVSYLLGRQDVVREHEYIDSAKD
jgi:hypothetical protein